MAEYEGVTSESPPDSSGQDSAPSAETLNTGIPAPSHQPTVPYERFHEVNTGYRQAEARAAAAEQAAHLHQQQAQQVAARLQALESQLQERAARPSRSPEEEAQRQQASRALRELQQDDPDYKKVLQLSKAAPALAQAVIQAQQQIAQLTQQHTQNFARAEEGRLYQMATASGMTFRTSAEFQEFNDHVAGIIARYPQAMQAFLAGDPNVVPAAFELARRQMAQHEQRARASVAQTKTALQRVPPRIAGSAPGSPPIPRFDPKDPRGSMARVHAAAAQAYQDLTAG
jgi:chromosome segregation ATPase